MSLKIKAYWDPSWNGWRLKLYDVDPTSNVLRGVVKNLQFEIVDQGSHTSGISIDEYELQHLFDDMWHGGFRPSKAMSDEGTVKAQGEHIISLRRVLKIDNENK